MVRIIPTDMENRKNKAEKKAGKVVVQATAKKRNNT